MTKKVGHFLVNKSPAVSQDPKVETSLFITHELSHNDPGLQAADLLSWGIFRIDNSCHEIRISVW